MGCPKAASLTVKVVSEPFQRLQAVLALPFLYGMHWPKLTLSPWFQIWKQQSSNHPPPAHPHIYDTSSQVFPFQHCLGQRACHLSILLHSIRIYNSRQMRFCCRGIWGVLQDLPWGVRKNNFFIHYCHHLLLGLKTNDEITPCLMHHVLCYAVLCLVTQSCPTLCDPMDCSPSGSSVHGILQARILE